MSTRYAFATFAAAAVAVIAGAASAAPVPAYAQLTIRHQLRGCHTWALGGGAYRATQTVALRRGGTLVVVDNDMMPHTLIQTAGPAAQVVNVSRPYGGLGKRGPSTPGAMRYMGAATKVSFAKPGVYRFVTRAGEDYMPMKTTGEDNVLRLIVRVR